MVAWNQVNRADVLRAIKEYDRSGPERFFSEHGFAPTTTYGLAWEGRRYPPKAILHSLCVRHGRATWLQ